MERQNKNPLEFGKMKIKRGTVEKLDKYFAYSYDFELKRFNRVVAHVKIRHFVGKYNFCYIQDINVFPGIRNQGIGRDIVLNINEFLDRKGSAGLLIDTSGDPYKNHPSVAGFYERNGWKQVPVYYEQINLMSYNLDVNDKEKVEEMLTTASLSGYIDL